MLQSVSVWAVVWFTPGTSVYHWANEAALAMYGYVVADLTGFPEVGSSIGLTRLGTITSCPLAPGSKSGMGIWNLKSRLTMGTWMVAPSGGCLHVNPDSMVQVDEQPSPDRLLPSSHCSPPSKMPSPHLPV